MKVKHYPRVSSIKQARSGDSVEHQENMLLEHSKQNDDDVVEVLTDSGKSASISDDKIKIWHKDGFVYAKIDIKKRLGMNKILDSLSNNDWETLKITKWDRFSRNNIFSQLMLIYFKENGKSILAVDDSNDSLVRDILGVLGQKEIEKMKSRVRDVRQMRFDKGIMVGRSPFGYKPLIKDKRIVGFKIDRKQAEIVSDCFKMASEGHSYSEICKKHKLKPQSYYNIIKNRVYCGFITFEGIERKGTHPLIISEELYNEVNKK